MEKERRIAQEKADQEARRRDPNNWKTVMCVFKAGTSFSTPASINKSHYGNFNQRFTLGSDSLMLDKDCN
ncbi:hypothetical protein DPMN_080817 [Dreissena polymorpha]|uniref:Uncharacterized protein n=1 Tax=Dreissena polymorpha TaxID=45954 RepID=A0A9D4BR93_DREPO|nr:hypothetical protein DPMN_080817 [Dreissena polymorpha]